MSDMNKEMRVVLYHIDDTDIDVNAVIQNDSIWITQKAMAQLFNCSSDNISLHLKNIYSDKELDPSSTTEKISVVRKEGNRNVKRAID
ncbi:MAG: cell filamentation protein Fic, partial [Oscillospiraceae bacterium]|nr:cell filamentation protein Fic [Oscillospiraceae bacterium]